MTKKKSHRSEMNSLDKKASQLMLSTQSIISRIQIEIETHRNDHVFGLAVGGASDQNIQAIASVRLEEWFGGGKLNRGLVLDRAIAAKLALSPDEPVSVVYISELVATPNERQKGVGAELVYGIVTWAKGMGREVMIDPANAQLEAYYGSLGFQKLEALGSNMMVYRGSQEVETPSRGLFLDLLQHEADPMERVFGDIQSMSTA